MALLLLSSFGLPLPKVVVVFWWWWWWNPRSFKCTPSTSPSCGHLAKPRYNSGHSGPRINSSPDLLVSTSRSAHSLSLQSDGSARHISIWLSDLLTPQSSYTIRLRVLIVWRWKFPTLSCANAHQCESSTRKRTLDPQEEVGRDRRRKQWFIGAWVPPLRQRECWQPAYRPVKVVGAGSISAKWPPFVLLLFLSDFSRRKQRELDTLTSGWLNGSSVANSTLSTCRRPEFPRTVEQEFFPILPHIVPSS